MNQTGSEPARKSFLHSSAFLRVAASIFVIPCFIIIIRAGGYHFLGLMSALLFVAMWEFYRMMESKGIRPYKGLGILFGIALTWYVFFREGMYANLFLTLGLLTLMGLELTRKETKNAVYHISTTILGVMYVAFLFSHLVMLRELPLQMNLDYRMGASFVFIAFIVTWSGDTGAYVVGSLVGRTPLIPRISAKKTLEGAFGGVAFAVIGAFVARATVASYLEIWQTVLLGVMAGVVGMLGDLFESMIKRDIDVKDASAMIPGHGGVLDRFDSLLFTAPLIYYFIKFVIF